MGQQKVILFFVVAGVVAFGLGYSLAAYKGNAEREKMISEYATRVVENEREYAKKLEREREQHAKSTDELLARLQESGDRERDLVLRSDRLQRELASRATRSTTDDGACGTCEKRFERCSRLLAEGVGLVSEGAGLAERIAVKKDGLVVYVK